MPARLRTLHGDQRGTMSILSVFAFLMLAILLGMVMNAGIHVDGKIRMQNAADAATYSAADCMARGMNVLAFTNHLTCEMLALTAYFETARDRKAEQYVPQILARWAAIAPVFETSGFDKFVRLGRAIAQKIELEQRAVTAFGDWAEAAANSMYLPLAEYVLDNELIPKYQRDVARYWPDLAQVTMMAVAQRNGVPDYGRGTLRGSFWWARGTQVAGTDTVASTMLPVLDPAIDSSVFDRSRDYRNQLTNVYLREWNLFTLEFFRYHAEMSMFYWLWQPFACANLRRVLNDRYPTTNLLFVIRDDGAITNTSLDQYYTYLGVVYWKPERDVAPVVFRNPLENDAVAFAEAHVFVPARRWRWYRPSTWDNPHTGGIPGSRVAYDQDPVWQTDPHNVGWRVVRQWSTGTWVRVDYRWRYVAARDHWNLLNQGWVCRLAPVMQSSLAAVLQTTPTGDGFDGTTIRLPTLTDLPSSEIQRISPH